ncbi:hypothetical protein IWZ01DRAFT_205197 [Phyllosticta capitalensis]
MRPINLKTGRVAPCSLCTQRLRLFNTKLTQRSAPTPPSSAHAQPPSQMSCTLHVCGTGLCICVLPTHINSDKKGTLSPLIWTSSEAISGKETMPCFQRRLSASCIISLLPASAPFPLHWNRSCFPRKPPQSSQFFVVGAGNDAYPWCFPC